MSRIEELEFEETFVATRQREIFDPLNYQGAHCTLVGCGGIGSFVAVALTKMGIANLTLIDFDDVEPHNMPNQFYRMSDIGKPKVVALQEICKELGPAEIRFFNSKAEQHQLQNVVVTGLDSMEARKEVWEMVKENPDVELLIDGRLGAQDIALYAINPSDAADIKYYEEWCLYGDDDEGTVQASCTNRAIIDVGFTVGALVANVVRKHYTNSEHARTIAFSAAGQLGLVTYE